MKEEKEKKVLNILDTPFGDSLEINFSEEYKEDITVKDNKVLEPVEEFTEHKTETKESLEVKPEDKKETSITTKKKEEVTEELKEEPLIEETVTDESESTFKVFANWLGEKGLVDYDEASFEDSEEGLKKLMSSTVEREVQNYKNSLPEDVHKLVEFVEAGGNPKDFIDTYYNQKSWSDFEINDENSQKLVLKEYLKAQGEDDEDISETLDTYEVAGILEKKSKAALTKLQNYEKNYQEQVLESQKKYDAEQKVLLKKQYDDFKQNLYSKEDIQGFKLTPKMKDDLWNFIMKPDKAGKTGLQKHNETNENAQFMYAYLAMNDWNLEKLERQVKTKVNSDLANKLSNISKDTRTKLKTGQSESFSKEREKSNFSAFKQAINNNLI